MYAEPKKSQVIEIECSDCAHICRSTTKSEAWKIYQAHMKMIHQVNKGEDLEKEQEAEDQDQNSLDDAILTESNKQHHSETVHGLHDQDSKIHRLSPSSQVFSFVLFQITKITIYIFQVPSSLPEAKLNTTGTEHQGARAAKRRVERKSPDKFLKRKCTEDGIPEPNVMQKDKNTKIDKNTPDQKQNLELNQAGSPSSPL